MKITDQSAHDESCSRHCKRLFWNETSYRSVAGARAVKLVDDPPQGELTYCEASGETLAVSHVWSHGQGGRPELGHGFNHCLHRRYIAIAQSLGCSSYGWTHHASPRIINYGKKQLTRSTKSSRRVKRLLSTTEILPRSMLKTKTHQLESVR